MAAQQHSRALETYPARGMAVHGPEWQTDRQRTIFIDVPSVPGDSNYWIAGSWHAGHRLQINVSIICHLTFILPADFVSVVSLIPVVGPEGTGNMRWQSGCDFAANGELANTHSIATGLQTTAVVTNTITELPDMSACLVGATVNDYINIDFNRVGTDALDTVEADIIFLGWKLTYLADM